MFIRHSEILVPENGENKGLVLIISPNVTMGESLKDQLLSISYSVIGPFNSMNSSYSFIRKQRPDGVIFHNEDDNDIEVLKSMLDTELKDVPLIFLSQTDVEINYDRLTKISTSLNTKYLEKILAEIIKPEEKTSEYQFVMFINEVTAKIVSMTPETFQTLVRIELKTSIRKLVEYNISSIKSSDDELSIQITNIDKFDLSKFKDDCVRVVNKIVNSIDISTGERWAISLFNDSIEQLLITQHVTSDISEFASKLGLNINKLEETIASVIPEFDDNDRNTVVFSISLGDLGPELRLSVSDSPAIKDAFNEMVASQILTLVGQGSMYHEGLFGPIPIPSSMDLTAIIYSKMVKSDIIKDERMKGMSLNVIGVGFKRKLINCIPKRNLLVGIFEPFLDIVNQDEITTSVLSEIQKNFVNRLQC